MSVTAVPLRPLPRGTLVKLWIGLGLAVVVGVALAWLGTQRLQREQLSPGIQYRVLEPGEGQQITPADLIRFYFVIRRSNGTVLNTNLGGEPVTTAPEGFIPGLVSGLERMRKGSAYRFWLPARVALGGQTLANAPFGPDEVLDFEIRIIDVAPGMAAMQSMMQQRQGGTNGPGGGAPMPMPPGAQLPGAGAAPEPGPAMPEAAPPGAQRRGAPDAETNAIQ